ncbi:succinate dehydrogenase cytochrome b556 subunit [Echinimonas agarilytica]|uniref:Succinate dehydrogenase cytochrome b556 subunit n=1 Tax=Echinimonas agarilytica TaxID=1215918 RepID=A0AA41W7U5_9GAMM|nr:succinate dehydrogenase cytochrome b556 subunit [Echinimonas agarilytica]
MNKNRPVNLDLTTVTFPATAIASILHRVTGVIMFFGIAILIWLLGLSLSSEQGFADAVAVINHPFGKFIMWGILTALAYHLVVGVRHLIMDLGVWEELESGIKSAQASFVISAVLAVLAGVWLW